MKKNEQNKLIRSYAEALYEAAEKDGNAEAVLPAAEKLAAVLSEKAEIAGWLASPIWNDASKKEALEEIAVRQKLPSALRGLLGVMADNGRVNLLIKTLGEFRQVYYAKRHISQVSVKTAVELTETQKDALAAAMEKYTGNKVVVKYQIKPEILGGLLVECGSVLIDDSVKGKLDRLELLMKGTI